jgi:two-component system response regulator AtoC
MLTRKHILIAEDEPEVRNFLRLALRSEDYEVEFAEDGEEVLTYLNGGRRGPSLLLLDIRMPRKDGLETLQEIRRMSPHLPVIMMSGITAPTIIVDAMKRGANDFIAKPVGHDELRLSIRRLLGTEAVKNDNGQKNNDQAFLPPTAWLKTVNGLLGSVCGSDVPVLLQGETGVGKEVLARRIHSRSPRADKPFLKLNCAALPSELVESELFGFDRGAFTGAFRNNPGKFEIANGGTILLDEIGDMDVRLQAKLLQVLQDKEFIRLGSKESTRVDVRVIAATHCDLEAAMLNGRFREDLYYRLNVVNIVIPPLRERKDEIIGLAEHFLLKHGVPGTPTPEILPVLRQALLRHDWPGNIRELENVLRKFLVVRNAALIAEDLSTKTRHRLQTQPSLQEPVVHTPQEPKAEHLLPEPPSERHSNILNEVEEERRKAEAHAILAALNRSFWNRKQAATLLDVDYKALLYKMKKLGIGDRPSSLT